MREVEIRGDVTLTHEYKMTVLEWKGINIKLLSILFSVFDTWGSISVTEVMHSGALCSWQKGYFKFVFFPHLRLWDCACGEKVQKVVCKYTDIKAQQLTMTTLIMVLVAKRPIRISHTQRPKMTVAIFNSLCVTFWHIVVRFNNTATIALAFWGSTPKRYMLTFKWQR